MMPKKAWGWGEGPTTGRYHIEIGWWRRTFKRDHNKDSMHREWLLETCLLNPDYNLRAIQKALQITGVSPSPAIENALSNLNKTGYFDDEENPRS
jgi:hypothetical protein